VSSAARLSSAPDIPPIAEAGIPGFDAAGWGMIVAAAGTPDDVVRRLNADLIAVLASSEVQQQIIRLGMVPASPAPPNGLQAYIAGEMARWGKVVHQAGLAGTE